ncbi:MAG: hypothetical protein JSU68_10100 [Phycisphaerales bacterium]|nr:MAG: hypothetical protein JSU68_10100 [Phycisphaerales bacterium]
MPDSTDARGAAAEPPAAQTMPPRLKDRGIQRAVLAERERLLRQARLRPQSLRHFKRPAERLFTRAERDRVTVLFGGLTRRHECLLRAGFDGLGCRTETVPTPTKLDFQTGREYGNNGQCNPAYFTVGALLKHLMRLRDERGLSAKEIVDRYVYLTAGACGPCRFGMYEAEYRLALHNAGFEGFRVVLFQQNGGMNQSAADAGLRFNLSFFLMLINSFLIGDLINAVAYHVRPYELDTGTTDAVLGRCVELCCQRLRDRSYDAIRGGALAWLLDKVTPVSGSDDAQKFLDQLYGDYYAAALRECASIIEDGIEVDYTRPKPIVKITGEFWAQTTEGDGNFNMFAFLEREGAEVLLDPLANWLSYILNQARNRVKDRRWLDDGIEPPSSWDLKRSWRLEKIYRGRIIKFALADWMIYREYERMRRAMGGTTHRLACQHELLRIAHPYYNSRSGGGEGHLEVAKNIYCNSRGLAHMVLSLKPFGCMPSTQSDGAQAAVLAHYPQMIYLPIETSGEGDVNAYSRTQMALGEAKSDCKAEFNQAVKRTGYSLEQIRNYVRLRRELRRPLQKIPKHDGVVGRAANFVLKVGKMMDGDSQWNLGRDRRIRE